MNFTSFTDHDCSEKVLHAIRVVSPESPVAAPPHPPNALHNVPSSVPIHSVHPTPTPPMMPLRALEPFCERQGIAHSMPTPQKAGRRKYLLIAFQKREK